MDELRTRAFDNRPPLPSPLVRITYPGALQLLLRHLLPIDEQDLGEAVDDQDAVQQLAGDGVADEGNVNQARQVHLLHLPHLLQAVGGEVEVAQVGEAVEVGQGPDPVFPEVQALEVDEREEGGGLRLPNVILVQHQLLQPAQAVQPLELCVWAR